MAQESSVRSKKPPLWTLIYLSSLVPFFIMLPETAVPQISEWFKLSIASGEWVVSICSLAYGFGALCYGPFSKSLGKKKTLLLFFFMGLIGSALCACSFILVSFPLKIIGRALLGFGVGSGLVISLLILNEAYEPQRARQLYSWVVPFFSFSPAVALAVGGGLVNWLGIYSLFLMTLILVVLGLIIILSIDYPEGQSLSKFQFFNLMRTYCSEISSWPFIRITVVVSAAMSSLYLFNGVSTLIAVHEIGVSPSRYGTYVMLPSLGLFMGAYCSLVMNRSAEAIHIIRYGIVILLVMSMAMLALVFFLNFSILFLLVPAFALFVGVAMVIPNASMLLLNQTSNPAVVSSLFNAVGLLVASLILSGASTWLSVGPILLPVALLLLAVIAMIMCFFYRAVPS
ncbi:MAG TPA: hypothetical protein DCL40_01135 [Coxiellaceae bacterium]|nr:hypothetical protein [Coxiellaceae bacterium]